MGVAPSPTPAERVIAIEWSTRASSSMAMQRAVKSPPEPPDPSGNGGPNRPTLPIDGTTSTGRWWSRSHASVDVVQSMGKLGLFGLPFPDEYGGSGGDFTALIGEWQSEQAELAHRLHH